MKKLDQLAFSSALGLALFSGDVFGSAATVSGIHCKPINVAPYTYETYGIRTTGPSASTLSVSCAIPMDSTALGSTVQFRMRVLDNTSFAGFQCIPYVYSYDGTFLAAGASKTTGVSFTGVWTMGGSDWPVTVPGTQVNTNLYTIQCTMPGAGSVIYTQRVQ